jgi:hypothetical protein
MHPRAIIINLTVPAGNDKRYIRTRIGIHPVIYNGDSMYANFFLAAIREKDIHRYLDKFEHVYLVCNEYYGTEFKSEQVIKSPFPHKALTKVQQVLNEKKISQNDVIIFSMFPWNWGQETIVECFDYVFVRESLR